MKTAILICTGALALAATSAGNAQSYSKQAELELAANGESFAVGDTRFRLAPSATVRPAGATVDPERDVVVADYLLEPPSAASANVRSKRSATLDDAAALGTAGLAVAVSDEGVPTVVAPQLDVYFDRIDVLDGAIQDTGGTLVYSSEIGGKATIGYASVAEAFEAMKRIAGRAGVKEVSPRIIQGIDEAQ